MELPPPIVPLLDEFARRVDDARLRSRARIFYHADPDGVCAAAAAHLLIRSCAPSVELSDEWVGTFQFDFGAIEGYLRSHQDTSVFCFDLNLSSREGFLDWLLTHHDNVLTIVDDHKLNTQHADYSPILLSPNIVAGSGTDFAPSLFAYLAAKTQGISLPAWLPAIGLFADRQLDQYRALLGSEVPSVNQLFDIVATLGSPFLDPEHRNSDNTVLRHLVDQAGSGVSWAEFVSQTRHHPLLGRARSRIDTELDRELTRLLDEPPHRLLPVSPQVRVIRQQSPYRFTNLVASRLRPHFPQEVVFVYREADELAFFEIRVGDQIANYDIVDHLGHVAGEAPLRNFGGHKRAAGGACRTGDLEQVVSAYARAAAGVVT